MLEPGERVSEQVSNLLNGTRVVCDAYKQRPSDLVLGDGPGADVAELVVDGELLLVADLRGFVGLSAARSAAVAPRATAAAAAAPVDRVSYR